MITKGLIMTLFRGAYMERWQDKLRPTEFIELDKQGHKMMFAYFLGKMQKNVDWIKIIEANIFEYLQRICLTDLKPDLFAKIKTHPDIYNNLNKMMFQQYEPQLIHLGQDSTFFENFKNYFSDNSDSLEKKILDSAHVYSSKWEYDIIKRLYDENNWAFDKINNYFKSKEEKYLNPETGIEHFGKIYNKNERLNHLVNRCGELRFQKRWSNNHRIPKTSVMGHSYLVAVLSYLMTLDMRPSCDNSGGKYNKKNMETKLVNNFFCGLFHDLPELLTRDVISPIKHAAPGLDDLIKKYEVELMNEKIFNLMKKEWHSEFTMFIDREFDDIKNENGDIIKDGTIVRACDELCAMAEAMEALNNGATNPVYYEAIHGWKQKYIFDYESFEKKCINSNKEISAFTLKRIFLDMLE